MNRKRVWWIAPTYSISMIAWRLAVSLSSGIHGCNASISGMTISFPGGGELVFKSSDTYDNLRGEGLDFAIFDEAAYQKEETWTEVMRPALSDRQGGAFFVSTPAEETGWFRRIYMRGEDPNDMAWQSWQMPSLSNPYLQPSEIEDARRDMPEIVYRREYNAEFVSMAGAQILREWLRYSQPLKHEKTGNFILDDITMGVDLAISERTTADFTAIVVMGKDAGSGVHWVLDAAHGRMSFHKQIEFIKRMSAKWNPRIIGIETNQYQAAAVQELLRTTDLNVMGKQSDVDKVTRAQKLVARYEQGLIHHLPGRALGDFEYELLSFPVGEHDDFVDAETMAYSMMNEQAGPVAARKPQKRYNIRRPVLRKAA